MDGQNATIALTDVLVRTRPWTERAATVHALADWWATYRDGPSSRGERGPWDVADVLRDWGSEPDFPADATDMVKLMLSNVAAGRDPKDYAFLMVTAPGISARQLRRYRHEPGPLGPLRAVFKHENRRQSLYALKEAGWKLSAARRLLERYPGWHAGVVDGQITWTADSQAVGASPPMRPR
jgi:hypothetical protein